MSFYKNLIHIKFFFKFLQKILNRNTGREDTIMNPQVAITQRRHYSESPSSHHPGSTIINSLSKLFSTLLPDIIQLQLTTFFKQTPYHFTFRYSICISKRAPFQNVTMIPFSHLKITAKILKITKYPVKFSYFPNGLIFHYFNQDPNKSTNCTGRYTIWQV